MCDDLFDEEISEERTGELSWLKTSLCLQKEGYREGLSAGKELSLQDGFNEGFYFSTNVLFQIAELRGEISGILSLSLMRGGTLDKSTESQLQELLGDVVLYETELLKYNKSTFEKLKSQSDTQIHDQGEESKAETVSAKAGVSSNAEEFDDTGSVTNDTDTVGETIKDLEKLPDKNPEKRENNGPTKSPESVTSVAVSQERSETIRKFTDTSLKHFKDRLKELVQD